MFLGVFRPSYGWRSCRARIQLDCRESTAASSSAAGSRNDVTCLIFCVLYHLFFAEHRIIQKCLGNFTSHNSSKLNEIRIIKV